MPVCPDCNGAKRFLVVHVRPAPGEEPILPEDGMMPCPSCRGTGEVTPEHLERYQAGQAIKRDRIRRGVGLREEAERLGILPSDYAALEHGRDFVTPEKMMPPAQLKCEYCNKMLPVLGQPIRSRTLPFVYRWYAYHKKPDGTHCPNNGVKWIDKVSSLLSFK